MNSISIVIPIFNEQDNINLLFNEINKCLSSKINYEIIFVDDGSVDNSKIILNKLTKNSNIRIIHHNSNLGQSYGLLSGIRLANNDAIVSLDGDGQNNPKDILKLTNTFFSDSNIVFIGGIRKNRKDNYIKIISSKIANIIRSFLLNDKCTDTGCGLKIFSKKIFLKLTFFNGIHRFLPALFKGYGYKTYFEDVDHRPRIKGVSKYGTFGRLIKGIIDIVRVMIIIRQYNKRIKK